MPKIFSVLGKVSDLCRIRGFLLEKEIPYIIGKSVRNSAGNIYDYGPLGVELKRNVINEWWHELVTSQDNIYGLDLSMLSGPQDGLKHGKGEIEPMETLHSLPPSNYLIETCGHALNYINNYGFKIPFGLAQNFKILSRDKGGCDIDQFIFRSQQKELLKLCFFCPPNKLNFWMDYWMRKRLSWWKKFADTPARYSLMESASHELSCPENSSSLTDTVSVEFDFPWGKEAIECISSYLNVQELIKTDMKNTEQMGVVVATLSIERGILAYLLDAFQEKELTSSEGITSQYNVLRLHPALAPVKVAVLSSNLENSDLCWVAQQLATELRQAGIPSSYVEFQDFTECYLKQDEVGTPYCVTIQDSTLTNGIVTLRNRDTTLSEFLHISEILKTVQRHLDSF